MALDAVPASKSRRNPLDPAAALAAELRRERQSQGMTLQALSRDAGVAVANLHRLENVGQGRVTTLCAAADALSVRVLGLPDRSLANDLPRRLRLAREQAELSPAELAAKAQVSVEAVKRLEAGGGNLSTLYASLRALGRTIGLRNEKAKVWATAVGDRDSRFTPLSVLDRLIAIFGPISLDPCWAPDCLVQAERTFNEQEDGLTQDWAAHFVYVNPPYSASQQWAAKCRAEYEAGRARVIVGLFKATTYGTTFQQIAKTADTLFLPSRVAFLGPGGRRMGSGAAPFGLVLYAWGASAAQVERLKIGFDARHLPPD